MNKKLSTIFGYLTFLRSKEQTDTHNTPVDTYKKLSTIASGFTKYFI